MWLTLGYERHGENFFNSGRSDEVPVNIVNVGGDILKGHSDTDSEIAHFLDGNLTKTFVSRPCGIRADYEYFYFRHV